MDCSLQGSSLCPWDSPGKDTGVACHALLQGIFLTQGSNLCLFLGRWCSLAPPTEASKCYSHNYTQIHRAGHQTFTSKPPFLRLNHNKCADSWCSLSLSTHALKSLPPCGERAQGPCRGHMWCSDWHPQLSPSPSAHQSPWSMWMRKLTDDRSASQHLSAEPSQPPGLRDIIIINDHRCFVATWSSCAIIDNPNTDNLLCSSLRWGMR